MHSIQIITAMAMLALLTGCASSCLPTVVEKPVVVERERLLPLPPDLLAPCPGKPPALPLRTPSGEAESTSNADLLLSWQGWQGYAACLESRLDGIRSVQGE